MRAQMASIALWGFLAGAGTIYGQVPTSFDIADMTEGRDPAKEARRHLAKAERLMRKVMKYEAKSSEAGEADFRERIRKAAGMAAEEAEKALGLDPLLVVARVVKGNALRQLGDAEGALDACATAVRQRPGLAEARSCLALAHLDLDQPKKTVEVYEDLVKPDAELERELITALRDWLERHPDAPDHSWLTAWIERSGN